MSNQNNDPILNAKPVQESIEQAVDRLSKLSLLEYETMREDEAANLGIRVSALDKAVGKARKPETQETDDVMFAVPEPWQEPVDIAALLDDITTQIKRFIICAPETANASALWIAFTWIIEHVQVAPIANITAPEMQCGKSQLLSVIGSLVKKPAIAANISPSVVFRVIEKYQPTLLIDEADSFMNGNEDLRGIINSGHTRQSAYVWRSVGDDHEPKQFSTWSAKAICGIGTQAATIMDRSIILELRRKLPDETVQRLRHADKNDFLNIRRKLARFAQDAGTLIEQARPALPESLSDRAQDNWEPLLAIADIAAGHWPETARNTALAVYAKSKDEDNQSAGMMLLHDIQDLFDNEPTREKITSADLLQMLCEIEERPWSEWNKGRPITTAKIARYLKPFGVSPKTIRYEYKTAKGYNKDDFMDAFARYIPPESVTPSHNGAKPDNTRDSAVTPLLRQNDCDVTSGSAVTDKLQCDVTQDETVTPQPAETLGCYGVTLSSPPADEDIEVF